jgi:predicted nucleotidyltransferase
MTDQTRIQWTADTILDFLREHRDELRAMGVVKIGLFGSYVRGEQRPDSDVDFLFTLNDFTWRRWMNVWNFLEDNLGVKVDLVPEEDLRPELHAYVFPEVRYAEGF